MVAMMMKVVTRTYTFTPTLLTQQQLLATAMEAGAPTAAGWKALCGLLYQSLQYAASLRATEEALKWLEAQAAAGHEYLGQCALFLKVIHARSLLKLGRVDEAEEEFGVLAGRCCYF